MAAETISRAAARTQGLKRYFTGKPCKRGHIAERYVAKAVCVACDAMRIGTENKRRRDRDYGRRNAEKARLRARLWKKANPERARATDRLWKKNNPDRKKEGSRRWYRKDPGRQRFLAARWEAENAERHKEHRAAGARRRRARNRGAPGNHTAADAAAILEAQGCRCSYCHADLNRVKKHLDHIVPLARGGSNDRSNIQWLCESCNLSKGASDPVEFAQRNGRLI